MTEKSTLVWESLILAQTTAKRRMPLPTLSLNIIHSHFERELNFRIFHDNS